MTPPVPDDGGPGAFCKAALAAAERGWWVFPLAPGSKRPRAEATEWETRSTTDPDLIARWWSTHPRDDVGVACGPSGLVVVDLDTPKPGQVPPDTYRGAADGLEVLYRLARHDGQQVARTFTAATPRGGRHLYYRAPAEVELCNTQDRLGWCIDTRAAGGYVVAVGSVVARRPYSVIDHAAVAELPAWIARQLIPPVVGGVRRDRPAEAEPLRRGRYAEVALRAEVARVAGAGPGARNEALRRAAWNLGRLVARGILDRTDVENALQNAAEAAGYRDGPRAAAAVVRSALDKRTRLRGPS